MEYKGGVDIKVIINGKEEILPKGVTVAGLLSIKGINLDAVIVEHNHRLTKKEEWGGIILKDNDRLEILKFVGGG